MAKPYIICVDDENYILRGLKEQLQLHFSSAYQIETAESGYETLEILSELFSAHEEVPLIISDYIMPDMKGDELLQKIREQNPDTVLILLTGQATLEGVINSVNRGGVFRYLEKPWKLETLYAMVSEALDYYYQEKTIFSANSRIVKINHDLKSVLEQRTEELAINRNLLEAADRVQPVRQMVLRVTDDIDQLLRVIQSGMDEIVRWKRDIAQFSPEKIEIYLKKTIGFYQTTSDLIGGLIGFFERDALQTLFYSNENHQFDELCAEIAAASESITKKVNDLASLMMDSEKVKR